MFNSTIDFLNKSPCFRFVRAHKNDFWLQAVVIIFIFIVLSIKDIYFYISGPLIHGWDSMGHYSIGVYYAEHIFPKTWGMIPNWFSGTTFPNFYPPLFYWVMALLWHITNVEYIQLMKYVMLCVLVSIPISMLWIARAFSKKDWVYEWAVVILAPITILLTNEGFHMITGTNFKALTQVGLIPFIFTYAIFLVFLRFLLIPKRNRNHWLISIGLLFLVLIGNAHVAPVAAILIGFVCLYRMFEARERHDTVIPILVYYISMGAGALSLASFWYVPLLSNYAYMPSLNIATPWGLLKNYLFLTSPVIILSWYFALKQKDILIYIINMFVAMMTILLIIDVGRIFPNITAHIYRWTPMMFIGFAFLTAFVLQNAIMLRDKKIRKVMVAVIIATVVFYVYKGLQNKVILVPYDVPEYMTNIVEYLDKNRSENGIVSVEKASTGLSSLGSSRSAVMESMFGVRGIQSAWGILRESSISSIFYTPVKNMFSGEKERWGIRSYLNTKAMSDSPISDRVVRAKFMGIDTFLVTSPWAYESLATSTDVRFEKDFGEWQLFRLKDDITRVVPLESEPVLLFSDISFKDRKVDEYTYARFQELVIEKNAFDITFIAPQSHYIDDANLDQVSLIVIDDFVYRDKDSALKKLSDFSVDNTIVMFEDSDPLYRDLLGFAENGHRIISLPRVKQRLSIKNLMGEQADILFQIIRENNQYVRHDQSTLMYTLMDERIIVDFKESTDNQIPILIKATYSDMWNASNNNPVYLATPSFMVVYARDDFSLEIQATEPVKVGYIVSGITLCILLLLYTYAGLPGRKRAV